MKKDFETFYNELNIHELRKEWKEKKSNKKILFKKTIISIFILDFILISMILVTFVKGNIDITSRANMLFLIIIIPAIIYIDFFILLFFRISTKKNNQYNMLYKKLVIKEIVNIFFNEVKYFPNARMKRSTYEEGFKDWYVGYYSDDYIEALIDNKYEISIAEVLTSRGKVYEDFKEEIYQENVKPLFHGIVAIISMGKSIKHEVKITTNKTNFVIPLKNRFALMKYPYPIN